MAVVLAWRKNLQSKGRRAEHGGRHSENLPARPQALFNRRLFSSREVHSARQRIFVICHHTKRPAE